MRVYIWCAIKRDKDGVKKAFYQAKTKGDVESWLLNQKDKKSYKVMHCYYTTPCH